MPVRGYFLSFPGAFLLASRVIDSPAGSCDLRLEPLDGRHADLIASWARDAEETFWLAPRTPPPLTGAKVRNWAGRGREQLMLCAAEASAPCAYGELNALNRMRKDFWLGHLVVDPMRRGLGLGRRLTELLVDRAFARYGARRVTLIVFPDNVGAIACYRAVGFRDEGEEVHHFQPYGRRGRLLRLAITADSRPVR